MEHRWGTRHPLNVAVRLDARPHLLAFARLRNASASGAYLETAVALPLMTRVHVELEWQNLRRGEPHRIAACVIRTDREGVALEWCDFAPMPILALIESRQARDRPESHQSERTSATRYLPIRGSRSTREEHSLTDVI